MIQTLDEKLNNLKVLRNQMGDLEDMILLLKGGLGAIKISCINSSKVIGEYTLKNKDERSELVSSLEKWLEELKKEYVILYGSKADVGLDILQRFGLSKNMNPPF